MPGHQAQLFCGNCAGCGRSCDRSWNHDVLEVLESMDSVSDFRRSAEEAEQVPDAQMQEDLEGAVGSAEGITFTSTERMPKTWTMRSISSHSRTAILSWGFTLRCLLLRYRGFSAR